MSSSRDGAAAGRAASAAFFDVDDTLISVKSIFRFLAFHFELSGRPPSDYESAFRRVRRVAKRGGSRHESLREYFRCYAGESVEEIASRGERWFVHEMARGGLFHPHVLRELERHASAGRLTVLVSGSFAACLDPIARHAGADIVLCSRPEIRAGRYTGEVADPMVGPAKSAKVAAVAQARGIDLEDSYAYGDHSSDLPLLRLVGHPVVVGDEPDMASVAIGNGWRRLPAVRA